MNTTLNNSWDFQLKDEFEKPYFTTLTQFVAEAYNTKTCYPPNEQIFAALKACSFEDVKVVLIGQDPYHGKGQANGLCFSYVDNKKLPPSLKNIYKEIVSDLGIEMPTHNGNLISWAKQGVLLINATLTVEEKQPGSHQKKGWETFTDAVIELISEKKEEVVFLLWGGYAQKKTSLIDANKHFILKATHPSPLGANKGGWFGCKHFSKTNAYLRKNGKKEIDWKIEEVNQPPTLFTL